MKFHLQPRLLLEFDADSLARHTYEGLMTVKQFLYSRILLEVLWEAVVSREHRIREHIVIVNQIDIVGFCDTVYSFFSAGVNVYCDSVTALTRISWRLSATSYSE